ncbi:Condensation domain-containing protein [Amycolatopsis lurida]|uniref:condensation domain-containing protein n=1 Tax=Amycolatopsis lurida TaxID=31959 RepID=UPI00089AA95D|nr:condensation domain-containing protein [Amycolatopsis lurida]SEC44022.1 Condensation domain-containing protein [Amycolatopsis lurida]
MDTVSRIPLSVGQQALWLSWMLEPERPIHLIPMQLLVRGELDVSRLHAAVTALGEAYPQLRGRVEKIPGGPVLTWRDAPEIPVVDKTSELERVDAVRQTWRQPFDLTKGPLARVHVLRGRGYTVFLLTVHHIVADGESILILFEALRQAYAGQALAPADQVGPLVEFARRSQALAETSRGDPARAHWRRVLGTEMPPEYLPPTGDGTYLMHQADVPATLAERIRARASELGVSYFTALLAGYLVTLRSCTGVDDLLVSLPFHGRTEPGLRDTVGYFVNALPFRHRLAATDTYAELVVRLRLELKACYHHAELPLPAIMREVRLVGPEAGKRTRQTIFQYWHAGARAGVDLQRLDLGDCVLSLLENESSAGFAMAMHIREDSSGTRVLWKDPEGMVGAVRVRTLAEVYLTVLSALADDPGSRIAPVLTGHAGWS